MYYESDERHQQMEMSIDNESMLVYITTKKLTSSEEFDLWCKEQSLRYDDVSFPLAPNDYIVSNKNIIFKKSIGELLFALITSDFNTFEGFKTYMNVWGFTGLIKVNEKIAPPKIDRYDYSSTEADQLYRLFYHSVNPILVETQKDFKMVVDFCINATNETFLEGLSPLQRYYAGTHKEAIPSLDKYSVPYSAFYSLVRPVIPHDDTISDMEASYSLEEFCNAIKSETFTIKKTYYSQDIRTFAYIEFFNLIENFAIKKCSNCKDYFVPKNKVNEIYCENCRHIGYINKVKNNEFLKAYNTAYKTKHAQKQRKKHRSEETKEKYQLALDTWRDEAKSKLALVEDGKISEEEFHNFLKSNLEV